MIILFSPFLLCERPRTLCVQDCTVIVAKYIILITQLLLVTLAALLPLHRRLAFLVAVITFSRLTPRMAGYMHGI